MSVHLAGSAEHDGASPEFTGFVAEVVASARTAGRARPRVALVAIGDDAAGHASRLAAQLHRELDPDASAEAELDVHPTTVAEHGEVPASAFGEVDGIVIGGGRTPAYRELLEPHFGELRRQVAAGVPYLGCSAGAAIAAERAIIGGWRIGGVAVAPELAAEGLDEVTVAPGIGLVDVAIDAHAAQWGTVSRLIAVVEAGLVEGGLAIDERTALVVGEGGLGVVGDGSVWRVLPGESGVVVSTMGA
ncbi:Type 1 glutamine amidotransferase-like domain-containing protein [Agromyces aerolatus]|uniref:Type 1 glutamine amidotransferase-like domain-containing protein n=1 Tax=Agromyces sp. LY-1074 TaxID=3074080 RepID=UPI0028554F3F|nr:MULTISPECIES: Type 1 glutamine amidotransferase-like domain-containing protein [unclassified Agromyces]MDR5701828.1 Type 1 glutamine amidotransferase-like domain-containing protein [Agromyces sp. LY-1074]MDR5707502.1 Type 1 glutamine amidotransferase-like domain-containing protein [Agromyces sp. LY-1358]